MEGFRISRASAAEVALEAGKEGHVEDPFVDGMLRVLQLEGARDLDFRIGGGLGYSNEVGVSGRDGSIKSIELSAAWQYR